MPKAIPPTNWRIAGPYDAVPSPTPLVNWRRPRPPPAGPPGLFAAVDAMLAHPANWPPRPPAPAAPLRRPTTAPPLPRPLAPPRPPVPHPADVPAFDAGPIAALRPPSPGASRSPRGPRTSAFAFLQTLRPPLGGSPASKRTAVETRLRGSRFTIGWSVRAYGTGPHLHARSTPGMGLPQSVPFRRVQGHLTRRLTRHRRPRVPASPYIAPAPPVTADQPANWPPPPALSHIAPSPGRHHPWSTGQPANWRGPTGSPHLAVAPVPPFPRSPSMAGWGAPAPFVPRAFPLGQLAGALPVIPGLRVNWRVPVPSPLAPRACPRRSSPANWRVPASPQLPSAPARHPWSTGQPLSFFPLSPLPPAPGQPGSTGEPPTPPGHLAVAPRMSARPTGEDPTALRAAGTDAGSPPPGYLAGALPPLHRALGTPADWPGSPTRARRPSLAARPRSIHQLAGFLRHGRRPGVIAPVAHTTRPPLQAPGAAEPVMGEVFLTNLAKVGLTLSDS